jgi:hypothetical protein
LREPSTKRKQARVAQVQEAERIYEWLVLQRETAGELISAMVRPIEDPDERADARVDLQQIADTLAAAIKRGSRNAVWQDYQHHFVGDRNRKRFFAELGSLTRLIASTWLFSIRDPKSEPEGDPDEAFRWNASLLPRSIARYVLRVAILHPGVLENFLPRFFVQASDFWAQKSTYRRAILILQAVPRFGWSAEKHTKMLMKLGALDPSGIDPQETVKKFIRDLRRRYQKYVDEKTQRPA